VIGNAFLKNQDIDLYAFTGSTEVGAVLQQAAGLRKTQLELGSIASTIVDPLTHTIPQAMTPQEKSMRAIHRRAPTLARIRLPGTSNRK
jgi:hypothetical protein